MAPTDFGNARHHQDVPRREGAVERQPQRRGRRDPCRGRRKRRRQVDPDEGAVGVYPAGTYDGEIVYRRRGMRNFKASMTANTRHRHHPPGAGAGAAAVDRENIFLGNEHARTASSTGMPTRSAPGAAEAKVGLKEDPENADHQYRRRQAAAGRNRQGAVEGGQAADPRRADRERSTRRTARRCSTCCSSSSAGHDLDPDLAQAQRGQGRRQDHRAARRAHHRDARLPQEEISEDRIITSWSAAITRRPLSAARADIGETSCSK
jgi:hypothetical protein